MTRLRLYSITLRLLALVCTVVFLLFGYVWVYWIALFVLPFGFVGIYLIHLARRLDSRGKPAWAFLRVYDWAIRALIMLGFLMSIVALVYIR